MEKRSEITNLLLSREYGSFWVTSLLSNLGTWIQSVAEPWLVLTLSSSPFLLGLDAFAMNAPFWLLTLAGGILADRKDRGRIIFVFQGIQMLCPLLIVILFGVGRLRVWMIIGLSLIVGITDALSMPAFSSIIPLIVSRAHLKSALLLNSVQFNLSRVLGPAIAGLLILKYGYLWCFGANAASYIPLFVFVYWLLPLSARPGRPAPDGESDELGLNGIKDVVRQPNIQRALISVLGTGFFCGPLITFSPAIVRNLLHADVSQFGTILMAFGIGGIAGPLLLLWAGQHFAPMKVSLVSALLYGLLIVVVSQVKTVWQLAGLLVGGGVFQTVANTSANTFLQLQANDDNRGRTASCYMLALRGGLSLGNLVTGVMVSLSSLRVALIVDGLMAMTLQAIILRQTPGADAKLSPASGRSNPVPENEGH